MSTATSNSTTARIPRHGKTMFWRFVWKEFRMLRSLWAAVAILALLVQCVERMLLPYTSERPLMLLYTALAAAVLYAVGAAATTFSVEHEEETYDLLIRIPTTWWPLFAGKLVVTLVSALLLAGLLSILTLIPHGAILSDQDVRGALGMLGFAIIEAVAWGTLFSLLIKRPLLAAIVTLFVGAVTINLAVSYSSTSTTATLSPEAYIHAIPLRATIVAVILMCSLQVASGWLTPGAGPGLAAHLRRLSRFMTWLAGRRGRVREIRADAGRATHRGMLARLLWQTWRESWKLLVAPLGIAALLFAGIAAALGLAQVWDEVTGFLMTSAVLFAPAIYGTMAFYADQRRGNYRFLAEHAARPRHVWLSRHIVWLGALLTIWFLMIAGLAAFEASRIDLSRRWEFGQYLNWGTFPNAPSVIYNLAIGGEILFRLLFAASFAALIAYGVGQLFSMTIRSEILAAFLALLLTPVVAAWAALIVAWQLSAALCMLPIFAGLMLATWLRAPDWIAGRNSLHAWWKPALAIVAPCVIIAILLPDARLAHMRPDKSRDFADRLAAFQAGDTTEASRTADMYARAAKKMNLDESTDGQLIAEAVDEAIEISKRPNCRFHFDPSSITPIPPNMPGNKPAASHPNSAYDDLNQLIGVVAGGPITGPDQPARRFLAALKMRRHLRSGQPSIVVIDQLNAERIILGRIADWALASGRTKEELREVLDVLTVEFAAPESPTEALLADHLLIRSVIEGKETPMILSGPKIEAHAYLAYLLNQLWWERERGLQALERITRRNIRDMDELTKQLGQTDPKGYGASLIGRWLRPDYGGLPELWTIQEPAAVTSYLVSEEYQARVQISKLCRAYCDNDTCRRATLLQVALALYKLDHEQYPPQLSALSPDYLEEVPLDPYSQQPFQYQPTGLSLPLGFRNYSQTYETIARQTPFFWSVGAGDVRLKEITGGERPDTSDPPPDDEKPLPQKRVRRYDFINGDQGWWNDGTLAFPLAK